ncbi:hypothetical protein BGX28_002916 [Mortierella sp. GBA30]|nr:hypothetical protein BGX28_002916 [Mortierella sp. GBA30]
MATDPSGSTLYGLTWEYNYSNQRTMGTEYVVLVKSNTNPVDLNSTSWSLVSYIDSRNVTKIGSYFMSGAGDITCAVSSTGVFAAISYYTQTSYTSNGSPAGIMYDPAGTMAPEYYYSGAGAWSNVAVSFSYNWQSSSQYQYMFWTKLGGTTETLVHFLSPYFGSAMTIGQLDTNIKQLIPVANWTLTYGSTDGPTMLQYSNNQIIWYKKDYLTLRAYPFTSVSSVMPTPRSFNTTNASSCATAMNTYIGTLQNSIFMACPQTPTAPYTGGPKYRDLLLTMDMINDTAFGPGVDLVGSATDMRGFLPVNSAAGQTSFALMLKNKMLYSMTLTGPNAGHLQGPVNLTIFEPFGVDPSPSPNPVRSGGSSSSSSSDSSDSTGLIVGIVAALIVIGAAFWCLARRQGKARNGSPNVSGTEKPLPAPQIQGYAHAVNHTQGQMGPNDVASYKIDQLPPIPVHPMTGAPTVPGMLAYPIPQGPGTSMPQNVYALGASEVGTNAAYTFQDQMQGLQFSNHPRPSFVTVAGGGDQSLVPPQPGIEALDNIPWSPRPFVPPSRSSGSNGGHSPNASSTAASVASPNRDPQEASSESSGTVGTGSLSTSAYPSPPSIPSHSRPSPGNLTLPVPSSNSPYTVVQAAEQAQYRE